MGNHALEGMIDFLLSDDPIAAGLRDVADFYVYPQVNPDGRVAGYYRGTPENPSKDYNRYWNNPTGFTDMTAVRNAMLLDTGGDIDYLFDFHGMFGPWSRPDYFAVVPGDVGSDFALALAELEPTIAETPDSGVTGMLRNWGLSQYGLKAEHAYTAEFGARPGNLEAELDAIGANYARALYRTLVPVPEPAVLATVGHGRCGDNRGHRSGHGNADVVPEHAGEKMMMVAFLWRRARWSCSSLASFVCAAGAVAVVLVAASRAVVAGEQPEPAALPGLSHRGFDPRATCPRCGCPLQPTLAGVRRGYFRGISRMKMLRQRISPPWVWSWIGPVS